SDSQGQETIELAHPLRVALGEIVVDRDHMNTAATERVEVYGQGRDQGFAFAGFHFGNLAAVQDHAADQLHVEMTHVEHAATSFADYGKSLFEDLIEDFIGGFQALAVEFSLAIEVGIGLVGTLAEAVLDYLAEFVGLRAQLVVRELLHPGFERVHALDARREALDFALVFGPKDLA